MSTFILSAAETASSDSWWSAHATLIVGLAGIIFSGFVGPTVLSLWSARRERERDRRATIARHRDDLRELLDEAAVVLGSAVRQVRPLLEAESANKPLPGGPSDFLGGLVPLGERLRLRVPEGHPVLVTYATAQEHLLALKGATGSQADWDQAVAAFETQRSAFLEAGRVAVHEPVDRKAVTSDA